HRARTRKTCSMPVSTGSRPRASAARYCSATNWTGCGSGSRRAPPRTARRRDSPRIQAACERARGGLASPPPRPEPGEGDMDGWYATFKFLHVGAAVIWIGGAFVMVVLGARADRAKNDAEIVAIV